MYDIHIYIYYIYVLLHHDSSTSITLNTLCICQQFFKLLKIFYEVRIIASLKRILKFDYLAFTFRPMIQLHIYFLNRHEVKVAYFIGYNGTNII